MEKVWEELKKIESEAEQIHSETLKKSEELVAIAKEDAKKLLSITEKNVEIEVNELLNRLRRNTTKERNDALEKNEENIKDLMKSVEKRFDEAVDTTFDAILGKIEV
jgi:vacuolar-type H+-ATPase subunit H